MKNLFKFGFFALAISLSVAACNSNKTHESATDSIADTIDSTAEVKSDSLEAKADTVDSVADAKVDSLKK